MSAPFPLAGRSATRAWRAVALALAGAALVGTPAARAAEPSAVDAAQVSALTCSVGAGTPSTALGTLRAGASVRCPGAEAVRLHQWVTVGPLLVSPSVTRMFIDRRKGPVKGSRLSVVSTRKCATTSRHVFVNHVDAEFKDGRGWHSAGSAESRRTVRACG